MTCHVHVGGSCGICSTHVRSTYKNMYTYKNADETCKMARHDEQVISLTHLCQWQKLSWTGDHIKLFTVMN